MKFSSVRPSVLSALLCPALVCLRLSAQTPQPPSPPPAPAAPETPPAPVPEPPAAPAPPPTLRELVDALPPADVREALNGLKTNYVAAAGLTDDELARATLEGLLARLGAGAMLEPKDAAPPAPGASAPFLQEILDNRIGYLRVGPLVADVLPKIDAALKTFQEKKLAAVVLDLRATPASSDFDLAAQVVSRFAAKGKPLFTLKKTPGKGQDRLFTSSGAPGAPYDRLVISLTDADTGGAPEVIAAALRVNTRSMVIGAPTPGQAVEYGEVALGDGRKLRVATGEIELSGGGNVFPGGVQPDLSIALTPEEQEQVFKESAKSGMAPLVFEREKPRFNEASLVAGTNPSIEADNSGDTGDGPSAPVRDTVLQKAVDLITTISVYEKAQSQRPPEK